MGRPKKVKKGKLRKCSRPNCKNTTRNRFLCDRFQKDNPEERENSSWI